ncbi:MAG: NrdH-redoxin [Chloroflexi bacterium]|nr:NrdH-redoxin [Chloroflexota bacterium]MDA0244625.1 glutaredoxin domain-containing protein [Chloroflexota bacterium]
MTTNTILMYSTTWCGDCRRAKNFFNEYGVAFTEINIEHEPDAAEIVRRLNGGYQSVPTILFPDGSVLVEPSNRELAAKTGIEL